MLNVELLIKIREDNPLVHNITNYVVANDVANVLLAVGASPMMANEKEEMSEIAQFSNALVLNIGTLNHSVLESMIIAGKAANKQGVPVILDPVGVGATSFRKRAVQKLFEEIDFTAVRGNAGEIAILADVDWEAKGVDAGKGSAPLLETVRKVAKAKDCIVAISGKEDMISDGIKIYICKNGHKRMSGITGTGCMLSGIVGAFAAVEKECMLDAVIAAHIVFGLAGEQAAKREDVQGPGTFRTALIDELEKISPEDVKKNAKLEEAEQ